MLTLQAKFVQNEEHKSDATFFHNHYTLQIYNAQIFIYIKI